VRLYTSEEKFNSTPSPLSGLQRETLTSVLACEGFALTGLILDLSEGNGGNVDAGGLLRA
jgi:hypothetical protein